MANKRILVIGGTGYIGSVLVDKLIKEGCNVAVLSRRMCSHDERYILGDVLDRQLLIKQLKDFDLIIYLAAVIRTTNKNKYSENFIGLWNTIKAMENNNIKKIVYFSTQAVYKKEYGLYTESKKICEDLLNISNNIDYMIIRPNYVYGIDKHNDIWKLNNIAKWTRLCPIIGHGNNKIQPITKELLCDETIKIINKWKNKDKVDISGNVTVSLNQIGEIISKRTKSKIIHIPIWFLKLFKKLVSFDIDGYEEDMIVKTYNIEKWYSFEEDIKKIGEL